MAWRLKLGERPRGDGIERARGWRMRMDEDGDEASKITIGTWLGVIIMIYFKRRSLVVWGGGGGKHGLRGRRIAMWGIWCQRPHPLLSGDREKR